MKEYIRKSRASLLDLMRGLLSLYYFSERTVDRRISFGRVISKDRNDVEYVSDIFKKDIDDIKLYGKTILRPFVAPYGDGKSHIVKQCKDIISKREANVIFIELDLSEFVPAKDPNDILNSIFQKIVDDNINKAHELIKKLRMDNLDKWMKEKNLFPSMQEGLRTIINSNFIEKGRLMITGRKINGELNTPFNTYETLSNFEAFLRLFYDHDYLVVMMYDELDMFIIEADTIVVRYFLEKFIRNFVDLNVKGSYCVYILLTCAQESYTKLINCSKPTTDVMRDKQVILLEWSFEEFYELNDKTYDTHVHLREANVPRLTNKECNDIIKKMNIKLPRIFIQKITKKLDDRWKKLSPYSMEMYERYEKRVFDILKREVMNQGYREKDCHSQYVDVFGKPWDSYFEKIGVNGEIMEKIFVEDTIGTVSKGKVDKLLNHLERLKDNNIYDLKQDKVIMVSPKFENPKYLKRHGIEVRIVGIPEKVLKEEKEKRRKKITEPIKPKKEKPKLNDTQIYNVEYWDGFLKKIQKETGKFKKKKSSKDIHLNINKYNFENILYYYILAFSKNYKKVKVSLYIKDIKGKEDENFRYAFFDDLFEKRKEIENKLGFKLKWNNKKTDNKGNEAKKCSIRYITDVDDWNDSDLDFVWEQHVEKFIHFKKILDQYILM